MFSVKPMAKNILFISPSTKNKGGIATVIRGYLCSDLIEQHNVFLVVSHANGPILVKLIVAIIGIVKTLYYLVFKDIDLVHIHSGDINSFKRKLCFVKLAFLFSCKIVYHHHGGGFMDQYQALSKKWKKRVKYNFEKVDLLICLSNSWKANIQQIAPNATIEVIPNGISLPILASKKNDTHIIRLTFLGLIVDRKGIFDLVKVIKRLINDGNKVQLTIGGNGETTRLLNLIKKYNITKRVKYSGYIQAKKKDCLLRHTDIFVLPSYAEAMPMSILEAMAYAVPVVSTYVGGIPELVIDGETGYLIDPGDLDALYEKISLLIQSKDIRRDFGNKGRLLIENKYNIDIISQKLSEIYNSFSQE